MNPNFCNYQFVFFAQSVASTFSSVFLIHNESLLATVSIKIIHCFNSKENICFVPNIKGSEWRVW